MANTPLWVFGYGSLMWNPGFAFDERAIARLDGFSRSFCMRSIHHRGTPEVPGLVLALDPVAGASCEGIVLRVKSGSEDDTIEYLRERELVSSAYVELSQRVELNDGRQVEAVTFVVDTDHVQYCGDLPLEEQAGIIARSVGGRGPNTEYLYNTAEHLAELGIRDAELDWLARRVREIEAGL